MEYVLRAGEVVKHFRETKLSTLKSPQEFRLTYNTRSFSGNYLLIIGILAIYALLTNWLLIIALGFLAGGFAAINKFAPEPVQVGSQVITQKSLYTALFVIELIMLIHVPGLPLLYVASPVSTFFWLVGSSSILILGHAVLMEPGIESEYQDLEGM